MADVFLDFDFYGAGNIGDDLMLAGFLSGAGSEHDFYCSVPRNYSHQQYRFPKIRFCSKSQRNDIATDCRYWIGVGDTPVQIKSGEWFLAKLERDAKLFDSKKSVWFMSGIGVEKEAVTHKDRYSSVLDLVSHIWTRDDDSRNILMNDFGIAENKVTASSDIANIALRKIFSNPGIGARKYTLGICYYDETEDIVSIRELGKFARIVNSEKGRVLMFANDVNPHGGFEKEIYGKMYSGFKRFFSSRLPEILIPEYFGDIDIESLTHHFRECEVVMTSRYHALLAAAWAGCKIVSLQRSSKVTALARELNIAEVSRPFTADSLMEAYENAVSVNRERLLAMADRANAGLEELVSKLK